MLVLSRKTMCYTRPIEKHKKVTYIITVISSRSFPSKEDMMFTFFIEKYMKTLFNSRILIFFPIVFY